MLANLLLRNCIIEIAQCFLLIFLKGDPLIAVLQIDRTADPVAVFFQRFLHGNIVPMGIDADIAALGKAPRKAKTGDAMGSRGGSNAVDNTVRPVVEPVAAGDPPGLVAGCPFRPILIFLSYLQMAFRHNLFPSDFACAGRQR